MKNQVGEMIRSTKVKKNKPWKILGGRAPGAPPSKSATEKEDAWA